MSNAKTSKPADLLPAVGLVALYLIGSDRYAGKITEVRRKGRQVVWTSECGRIVHTFNKCQNGEYRAKCSFGHLKIGNSSPTDLDPNSMPSPLPQ